MSLDWNKEIKNLKGIGDKYGIGWCDLTINQIKKQLDGCDRKTKIVDLTKAFQTIMKLRNYFRYGA